MLTQSDQSVDQSPTVEKAKSQNGASTDLSQGTNEADDEFKVKKDQKFEFINQQVDKWPQWSIEKQKTNRSLMGNQQEINQAYEKINAINNKLQDYELFTRGPYTRSLDYDLNVINQQQIEPPKKKSFARGVVDKIKGWFK